VRRARPGQPVAVFGPRLSLDLAALDARRGVLVGDETAIGLAAAWQPAHAVIEVDRAPALRPALQALGLKPALVERQAEARHDQALADAALATGPDRHFLLVGRAHTVQALLRTLRQHGVASSHIRTKAYWADGKTGLD
jgi:NADPH-dependent ferric siderophore reductase